MNELYRTCNTAGYFGFDNGLGEEVVPHKYSYASEFVDGFAIVRSKARRYGVVDATGREVVPCVFENLVPYTDGTFHGRFRGHHFVVDRLGQVYEEEHEHNKELIE